MRHRLKDKCAKEIQGDTSDYIFAQVADKFNTEELTFSFSMKRPQMPTSENESMLSDYGYLNVFRPHILELIHRHQKDSHFVIYSFADALAVYHHIILIEMYYNLVYRLHPDRNQQNGKNRIGDFKYFRVITKLWTVVDGAVPFKSLSTVRKVAGSMRSF